MIGWLDREPGLREVRIELARCLRRARAAWRLTLLITVLAVGLLVTRKALTPPLYPARLMLRVTEGDLEAGATSPRTAGRLNEYVRNAVFSDENLLEIMGRHNISPSMRRRNQPLAIDDFREGIAIDVSRNHFVYERQHGDPPRSARLTLTYRAADPRAALLVVQDLGDLIISYEANRRQGQLLAAVRFQQSVVQQLGEGIAERERELAAKLAAPDADMLEIVRLRSSLERLHQQHRELSRQRASVELQGSREQQESGLKFERVDWRADERPARRDRELLVFGLVILLGALPICVLAVGAFGARVYAPEDVRRLGIEPLGIVHVFPRQTIAAAAARRWKRARTTA